MTKVTDSDSEVSVAVLNGARAGGRGAKELWCCRGHGQPSPGRAGRTLCPDGAIAGAGARSVQRIPLSPQRRSACRYGGAGSSPWWRQLALQRIHRRAISNRGIQPDAPIKESV